MPKWQGNNSRPMNKRGKFTRAVLRQLIVREDELGGRFKIKIFHKLRGRTTQNNRFN